MAQATDLPTTSRFHNLSNAALADALGHVSVVRDFETGGGLNQERSLAHHG